MILEIEIQGALEGKGTLSGHIAFVCDAAVCRRAAQTSGRKRDRDHGGDRVPDWQGQWRSQSTWSQYDYLVINDDLDVCVSEMHKIIQGEHQKKFP